MRRNALCALGMCVLLVAGCHDKKKDAAPPQDLAVDYYTPNAEPYTSYADSAKGPTSSPGDEVTAYPTQSTGLESTGSSVVHKVVKGDTLYKLARQYYSDQGRWKDIFEANRNVLTDPNQLRVGQELVIP